MYAVHTVGTGVRLATDCSFYCQFFSPSSLSLNDVMWLGWLLAGSLHSQEERKRRAVERERGNQEEKKKEEDA